MKTSTTLKNAMLDVIESTIGASPVLKIFSGIPPIRCSDPDDGTVLATINLPADWMAAAASGSKSKSGTWQDASADASGEAFYFRIYAGATCHMQGIANAVDGDLLLSAGTATAGESVTISTFTWSEA